MILPGFLFSVSLAASPGLDSARLLLQNGDACKMSISMKALSTDAADVAHLDEDRKKSLADLDEYGPAATASAANSPDLQAAIKAFYSIATAYCKTPSDAGATKFDDAEKTLDKMLDAAGR